jgi:hypothetical protein
VDPGRYEADGVTTSWIKIKNASYPQSTGRRELLERTLDQRQACCCDRRTPVLIDGVIAPNR